ALERGPGVHVVADAQPARAGRALAAALRADLADTAATAEQAINERLGQPRDASAPAEVIDLREGATADGERAEPSPDAKVDQLLADRLATYDAPGPLRTLAAAHVARLRLLAAATDRAERISARTQRASREGFGASASADPAAQAAPLGRASADLLTAQRNVDALEAAADRAAEPGATLQQIPSAASNGPRSKRLSRSPDSALMAGGVLLLSVALAGAILLTALPRVVAIAPILIGLFGAALIWRMTPGPAGQTEVGPPRSNATQTRSAGVSINAPTAAEARSPREAQDDVRGGAPAPADLISARQQLEDARQTWSALAGGTTDPRHAAGHASRDNSQAADVNDVVSELPAVRAAAQLAKSARRAWERAWTELGEEAPADVAPGSALEAAMLQLRRRIEDDRPAAAVVAPVSVGGTPDTGSAAAKRQRLNELLASRKLEAVLDVEPGPPSLARTPLVLVEPFVGLDAERRAVMQHHLEMLAGHHEVIVIVQSGPRRPLDVDS
ncbi:MAG: hypothetical protein M3Z46_04090, partial [Actinomycetota bacterium]|nr:hypothetical protein [Actinomycetota bacterium]